MTEHKARMVAEQKWGNAATAGFNEKLGLFQVSSGYTNNLWGSSKESFDEAFREADKRARDMGKRVTNDQSYRLKD